MDPMKAPAAASPADLITQTRGGPDGLVLSSELELGLGSGIISISDSESEAEGFTGVAILLNPNVL